jgi:hypothetical protein
MTGQETTTAIEEKAAPESATEENPGTGKAGSMFSLSNIKVGARVALVVALPVIMAAMYGISSILDSLERRDQTSMLVELSEDVSSIGSAVHELQRERGLSALFINSGGNKFAAELAAQRKQSDAAIASFRQKYAAIETTLDTEAALKALKAFGDGLSALAKLRADIDAMELETANAGKAYTGTIAKGGHLIENAAEFASDAAILHDMVAYIAVTWGKEFAGQERALGATIISTMSLSPAELRKYF